MMLREEDVPRLSRALERQEHDATALLVRTRRLRDDRPDPARGVDVTRVFLDGMTYHLEADIKNLRGIRSEIERWAEGREAALSEGPAGGSPSSCTALAES